MGSVLAELLHQQGCEVSIATPAPQVAYWSQYTLEQGRIHQKMLKADIKIFTQKILTDIQPKQASLLCSVSGQKTPIDIDSVLLLTDSLSNDALYQALKPSLKSRKLNSLKVIGDAEAPGIIADAVFSGYKVAYAMDGEVDRNMPFKVERVRI